MRKVFVIGIDGMDADFVADHIDEMPNFRKLRDRGFGGGLRSVFPTDSIPAWITIFTAIPPVEHGLLDAIDYFKKGHKDFAVDLSTFKGRTFWDVASDAGLRCCILNPFMAYPPWDINGFMASGPVFVDEEGGRVTPESMTASYPPPDLGGIVDFPTKERMGEFVVESRQYTKAQHEYGLRLLDEQGPFDLYFSTYLTLDRMQHFLWRYHDREDPTWPGPNDHQSAVLDAYLMFDDILGDYIERAGEDTDIIVISDHGHGRRCTEVVNVNEVFRRRGWLKTKGGDRNPLQPRRVLQQGKRAAMELLDRLDLTDYTHRIAKAIPQTRALKKASFLVDESANPIHAPLFAGTNPCGGVNVNEATINDLGMDYESARDAVIAELRELTDPRDGRRLFTWVVRREEVVGTGSSLDRFPDVLYLMEPGYGTAWDLFGDVVGINPTHRKISGGHKVDGVLYTSFDPSGVRDDGLDRPFELLDVSPMILARLGQDRTRWMARPLERTVMR
jgi:predicted AlkP superfamily phosphohydrolase/phosphomutase